MGSKFFVYAGRRWRELDTESGELDGWGRARFVYFRHGRLNVARRGAVLRALRELGMGCGKWAKDGLPLSKCPPAPQAHPRAHTCVYEQHHEAIPSHCTRKCPPAPQVPPRAHTCWVYEQHQEAIPSHCTRSVQCAIASTANASTQVSIPPQENQIVPQTHEKPSEAVQRIDVVRETDAERRSKVTSEGNRERRKRKRSPSPENVNQKAGDGDHLKELIIDESDVELLRRFLATKKGKIFKVDIEQFDEDDAYKEKVFYSINPLVSVERCPRIGEMLKKRRRKVERSSSEDSLSLKQFMSVLGLRNVGDEPKVTRYKTRASISKHNKENEGKNNIIEISSGEEFTPKTTVRRPHSTPKGDSSNKSSLSKINKGSNGKNRDYSAEEDSTILKWVSQGNRARRVNGNKIWQLMQSDHRETTGIGRSWHSLRNRYLRHLLPALPRLVEPQRAERLRADAHTGELKARKGLKSKENSLLAVPRVRSAWSRRPRPRLSSDEDFHSELDEAVAVRRSPRFSEVLRRFADRSPAQSPAAAPRGAETRRRRLYNPHEPL